MNLCPNCKSTIIEEKQDSSITYKCSQCDYSVTTSIINLMYEDMTLYKIFLIEGNKVNQNIIKTLKKYLNTTTSSLINIIKSNNNHLLHEGFAPDIKQIIQDLDNNRIKYEIKPFFPW